MHVFKKILHDKCISIPVLPDRLFGPCYITSNVRAKFMQIKKVLASLCQLKKDLAKFMPIQNNFSQVPANLTKFSPSSCQIKNSSKKFLPISWFLSSYCQNSKVLKNVKSTNFVLDLVTLFHTYVFSPRGYEAPKNVWHRALYSLNPALITSHK